MTDKRFINDIDNGKLIDTKGELSTIYYSDSVDFYELWEFLNKLNDENEQLKYNLFAHMIDLNNYKGKCSALEIENEQLKKQTEELKVDLKMAKIDGAIDRMAQRPIRW